MPCRSDYLEPTERERELKRAAKLLVYVLNSSRKPVNSQLLETSTDVYATKDYVPQLCKELRSLMNNDPVLFKAIVYDAYSEISRDLANWWERHEAEDRKREKLETIEAERRQKMTRLEELRMKYRSQEVPEPVVVPKVLTVAEAIQPLVMQLASYSKRELISAFGGQACGCMGPREGMPLCPCRLRAEAIKTVLLEKYGFDIDN